MLSHDDPMTSYAAADMLGRGTSADKSIRRYTRLALLTPNESAAASASGTAVLSCITTNPSSPQSEAVEEMSEDDDSMGEGSSDGTASLSTSPADMARRFAAKDSDASFWNLPTDTGPERDGVLALTGIRIIPLGFESVYAVGSALLADQDWKQQISRGNLSSTNVVKSLRAGGFKELADLWEDRVFSGCAFNYEEDQYCNPHVDKGIIDPRWMLRATQESDTEHYLMVECGGNIFNIVIHGPAIYFGDPDHSLLCKVKHAVPSPPAGSGNIVTLLVTVRDGDFPTFTEAFIEATEGFVDEYAWEVPVMTGYKRTAADIPRELKGGPFAIMMKRAIKKGPDAVAARLLRQKMTSIARAKSGASPRYCACTSPRFSACTLSQNAHTTLQ
jgi:hypothetical protein